MSCDALPARPISNDITARSFGENDQDAADDLFRSSLFVRRFHTWLNFTGILLVEMWCDKASLLMVGSWYSRVRCFSTTQSYTDNNETFRRLLRRQARTNAEESTHTANTARE